MKSFILSMLFLSLLQTSFAQNYEYDIQGNSFADTLIIKQRNNIEVITEDKIEYVFEKESSNNSRKVNFEDNNLDSNYIYHKVGEGESIEYILNLYQICAPCFAEWNNFKLKYSAYHFAYSEGEQKRKVKTVPTASKKMMLDYLRVFNIHEGEYLKVALKKDYQNGMSATFKTRAVYVNFERRTYVNDEILRKYNISREDFLEWNSFLEKRVYHVQDMTLIVGKIEYKYTCPCIE